MRGWLWIIVFPGCASGEAQRATEPADTAVDSSALDVVEAAVDTTVGAVDTATEDTLPPPSDAIFPTEQDVAIADVKSCEGCIDVDVDVAECTPVNCPAAFPFVVGCSIKMGALFVGCVAHAPGSASVTFKVGGLCGLPIEKISGVIRCSKVDGPALNAMNCPISAPLRQYVTSLVACGI